MDAGQLTALFDQQAQSYDQQWARLAPLRDSLHLLLGSVLAGRPDDARVLCVGAGTGAEIVYLADRFPGWTFTAVEPSAGMLEVCRQRMLAQGLGARCSFHHGYVESLPDGAPFDAATCLLVSQFILEPPARTAFFRSIAGRLRPGALLASADLAFDTGAATYPAMLEAWMRTMSVAEMTVEGLERMRAAYRRDVAILAPGAVEAMIRCAGFDPVVQFHQAGLIHAWYAVRRT